jgi:hypothetical protein
MVNDKVTELASAVAESDATVWRQILRVAAARGWAEKDLGRPPLDGTPRKIVRLAIPVAMLPDIDRLRGEVPLSKYVRLCAYKFIMLHGLGDRSVWALDVWIRPDDL